MVIFAEVTEKECVKERHPHLTAKIRTVQDCTAISEIAKFLFDRFWCFGLKLPIHALGGIFPPNDMTRQPRNRPSVRGNTSFYGAMSYEICAMSHKACKTIQQFELGAGSRERKGQDRL